ncbi:MAG: hypothetical protein JO201_07385 [Verrucomicrobia bacterium]|nr:hypothetical protein [Verrucomicrobiota bacterium]
MNWEAISALGQIVGAIAVVISVIYLALQVRGNARQTRLASMRSMGDAFNGFLQGLAGNEDLDINDVAASLCPEATAGKMCRWSPNLNQRSKSWMRAGFQLRPSAV